MKRTFYLTLIISLGLFCHAHSQTINIHSISYARQTIGDNGYTLDGFQMSSSRQKLLNPTNFSATGIYPKSVNIFDGYVNSNSLINVSTLPTDYIFFFGAFNQNAASLAQFTTEEIDSLYSWSVRGGKLIIGGSPSTQGYAPDVLNSKWGFDFVNVMPSYYVPTPLGQTTDIFNGPFGSVIVANQGGGAQGYFTVMPTNSTVLAVDVLGNPTIIMDCNTLDLIVADVDGYTSLGGVSSGNSITSVQDKYWANTIAFMDGLQPLPVISFDAGVISLNSEYVEYQWYNNGNPISQEATYAPVDCGVYYVEVTFYGGCKVFSDSVIVEVSSVFVDGIDIETCYSYLIPGTNINFTESGSYVDTIAGINGCDSMIVYNITIHNSSNSSVTVIICDNDTYTSPSGIYTWNTPGQYVDILTDGNVMGCDSIIFIELILCDTIIDVPIEVEPTVYSPQLEMPNVFTPNNDGINDYFKPIIMQGVEHFEIVIYNRWGQEMYRSGEKLTGWDGKFNGNECSEGVYFWEVQYVFENEMKRNNLIGQLTLLR